MRYLLSGLSQGRRVYFWGCRLDDDPTGPGSPLVAAAVESDAVNLALDKIGEALPLLPEGLDAAGQVDAVNRALESEVWTDPAEMARTLTPLAEAFLPAEFARALREHRDGDPRHQLVVHPCRPWSLVPWELLPILDGAGGVVTGPGSRPRVLLDVADVQYAVPAAVAFDRPRDPDPYDPGNDRPLYTVDPLGPGRFLTRGTSTLATWIRLCQATDSPRPGRSTNREELSARLHQRTEAGGLTRWLFLGHCAAPDDPASPTRASIKITPVVLTGRGEAGRYEPLTAYEMIFGDDDSDTADGHERWPMPPRVSIIACASGTDQRNHEPLGLVTALINSGAEYVTATRWILPTDPYCGNAMTALALAVDAAQQEADPIPALAAWQRDQLTAWRADPAAPARSPLLWAAPTTFRARNVSGQAQALS